MAALGTYRQRVVFQKPGPVVPDGDGGAVASWIDLVPAAWKVSITPATTADQERIAPGTVISTAASIVRGPVHPGVTTQCRLLVNGRVLSVTGVTIGAQQAGEMELGAVEVVL